MVAGDWWSLSPSLVDPSESFQVNTYLLSSHMPDSVSSFHIKIKFNKGSEVAVAEFADTFICGGIKMHATL